MKVYYILSNTYPVSIELNMWFFAPDSIYVLYYIYWFVHVETFLCPGNETNWIMAYDLFNVLLNLVCKYVNENLCVYVY
jgi:hypothetical protein